MFSNLLHRKSARSALIEFGPHQALAARLSRPERGALVIDGAAEFKRDDDAALGRWLAEQFDGQKSWTPAICGFFSDRGILQRETVQPRNLANAGYLADLAREHFKIGDPGAWQVRLLDPIDGTPLAPEGTARSALISCIPHAEIRAAQQRLLRQRLMPERLESSLLPLFGVIVEQSARQDPKRCPIVVFIGEDETATFILGKEGVHTTPPIGHGFKSILNAARVEFSLPPDADVREVLRKSAGGTRFRAPKFMRAIGRDLKPLIHSYEMSTGQVAGGLYCVYLPHDLSWIAEPFAKAVDCQLIDIDCNEWMSGVGLQAAPEQPPLGSNWLGALSLVAQFRDSNEEKPGVFDAPNEGRWHVDCRLSGEIPNYQLVGRRFLSGLVAGALAAFAVILAAWQFYVISSLRGDTAYWQAELSKDRTTVGELRRDLHELQTRPSRLDYAYDLMASPYEVSDFVLDLGRTLPPNMRIDLIAASRSRVTLAGGLHEPSETASESLNRYLDKLRHSAKFGPRFSSIALTALQRDESTDSMAFEITFRPKALRP